MSFSRRVLNIQCFTFWGRINRRMKVGGVVMPVKVDFLDGKICPLWKLRSNQPSYKRIANIIFLHV